MRHTFELIILIILRINGTSSCQFNNNIFKKNIFHELYFKVSVTYSISNMKFCLVYFIISIYILYTLGKKII